MKTTRRNLVFLTLLLSFPTAHAAVTFTASDTFSPSSGSNLGNLSITGDMSIYKGLDVGTTVVGAVTTSAINIDWYSTPLLPKTASFDLTDANATFQWRDNLAGGAAVRNKMTLNSENVLSLYNAAGAAANITLNGNTGALTLAGGLGVAGSINTVADSYLNGVRVGKGAGTAAFSTAVGRLALTSNTTGVANTALGNATLNRNVSGHQNTAVGNGALGGNVGGNRNSAFGAQAGSGRGTAAPSSLVDAENSVFIGASSLGADGINNNTNSIVIGANAVGEGSNTTVIGNTSTTKTRLFGETVSSSLKVSGGTVTNSLSVSGGSHLGATAENLLNLPVGVTGSYYGPQRTGSNFYQHDFTFTKTGDEATGGFTVPLGIFFNIGGDITVDISTPSGDPDSGSAHFVLSGKRFSDGTDPLIASEYRAFGGASDLELFGRSHHGHTILFVKFNAKNYGPSQVYEHIMQVTVSGQGFGAIPQHRDYPFSFVYPITKVDSTTRTNGGTTTKSITAAEIKLDGKVTISQPQGDISMGIYQ